MLTRLLTFICRLYRRPLTQSTISVATAGQIADIPRYPPFDRGLPAVAPEQIVETQRDLIDRIERTAGLTPAEFDSRIMPVILNLAAYVHLLPATNTGHHCGAGGLFRMALEIALHSLQVANSTIFSNKGSVTTEARFMLHPRWVHATFIAGLCAEIYRPIVNMVVVDDAGDKWPQLLVPLQEWLEEKGKGRYFIIWNVQDEADVIGLSQASSAYLLNAIIPMPSLQYLNECNSEIVATMTACVTGGQGNNQIRQIISSVRNKVIERDIKSNSEHYGNYSVGSHLEPHLIDAMRRLVRKKTWDVNVKGARVWYSGEGVFVVWQPAAREIISLLTGENQAGIPQDADTLADILVSSGVAERNDEDGRYWDICVPVTMQVFPALKLSRIEILFPDSSEVMPIAERLMTLDEGSADDEGGADHEDLADNKTQIKEQTKPSQSKATEHASFPSQQKSDTPANSPSKRAKPAPAKANQTVVSLPDAASAQPKSPSKKAKKGKLEDLGAQADKLFSSLPLEVSDYLRAIVEDYQDKSSLGPVFPVEGGMAISTQELDSHGQSNSGGIIKALSDKGWLWSDPVKPMRKLFELDHAGQKVRAIIIRADIARGMGLDWKKQKAQKELQSD